MKVQRWLLGAGEQTVLEKPRRRLLNRGLLIATVLLSCSSFAATVPLPLHWWSRGAGGGGAFFSPSLSPLDPGALYISTDMGTVFHSANGGALWDSYAFGNLQGGRLARMQFTSDPAVLYVLDGRVDYVQYLGGAIFKSLNGGSSWFRLTNDPCLNNDATRKKLRTDTARTDHLVLGHDRGVWFSGDGGTNWTAFYSPGSGCYLADTFFAGSNIFAAGNFGLYVSTNNGSTFATGDLTGIGVGEKIVAFAGAARNGQIRLYCITTDAATAGAVDDGYPSPPELIYGSSSVYKGLYACDWGAGTWTKFTMGLARWTLSHLSVQPSIILTSFTPVDKASTRAGQPFIDPRTEAPTGPRSLTRHKTKTSRPDGKDIEAIWIIAGAAVRSGWRSARSTRIRWCSATWGFSMAPPTAGQAGRRFTCHPGTSMPPTRILRSAARITASGWKTRAAGG